MAWLEKRNDRFRVGLRYGGRKYHHELPCGTDHRRAGQRPLAPRRDDKETRTSKFNATVRGGEREAARRRRET